MKTQDNQRKPYTVYLKSTREWAEVPEDFYREYTRKNNTLRKRLQDHGQCCCPRNKWWLCDGACFDCEFQITTNDYISLDYTVDDGEGNERSLLDSVEDYSTNPESIVADQVQLAALYEKLHELDPEGQRIAELVSKGATERDAASALGLSRNTYTYRRDKLLRKLAEALKEYR